MDVEIVYATPHLIDIVSKAAGTSYGKRDPSFNRLYTCLKNGHMSVFEHAGATFHISGISRACSHQLVRHRVASFVQKSQRYTKVEDEDWYVMPPSFEDSDFLKQRFVESMTRDLYAYEQALKEGIKPEDARYLLPEATETEITMTMNLRELFHFFDLRCDKAAQWEIRDLTNEIKQKLRTFDEDWGAIITLYELEGE